MTKRERFLAFANFEPVDRVPRRASFTPHLREKMKERLGEDAHACFDMDAGRGTGLRPPPDFEFPDYTAYFPEYEVGKNGFTIGANGCGHINHGFYHFTERVSPLRNTDDIEDIRAFPVPSNETWLEDSLVEVCDAAHTQDDYAKVFVGHMYENAWQVRGYQKFLIDLITNREAAEILLDRYCENNVRTAVAAARAGYDCLATGDDVANQKALMFQPDLWREVMKPRWAKVIAAAREIKPDIHVWYHSDGNLEEILDDLVEIGVTILNPVQPECMDPFAIRKRFGKRLAFDGCVGTQTTFPFGTPDDMRRVVHELAEGLDALEGGLMLSPTHVLEPEVPPENVITFFETCDELVA